jgi:hypothetical protein
MIWLSFGSGSIQQIWLRLRLDATDLAHSKELAQLSFGSHGIDLAQAHLTDLAQAHWLRLIQLLRLRLSSDLLC